MTWHDFLIIQNSQNKHRGMTWLKYITIHPGINIGVQYIRYTSGYISKLQIHQHSLLTRKVFSRHNLSAQVFFSISSRSSSSHLHLQVIFIFKSSSSSLDHHWIWIIIESGSSLDLEHHWIVIKYGSSLDHNHHHWFLYLNQMVLSLHSSCHRNFYRANPFHAICRPSLHVGLHR